MTKRRANFCPTCGAALEPRHFEGRGRPYCQDCAAFVFQNPAPGGHVVVLADREVLLIERGHEPAQGMWAVPGGFLEVDEPPATAAARELEEEAGLTVAPGDLTFVRTSLIVDEPEEGSYLSLCFAVEREDTKGTIEPGPEATDARLWDPEALVASEAPIRPVDRRRIEAAFDRLRGASLALEPP